MNRSCPVAKKVALSRVVNADTLILASTRYRDEKDAGVEEAGGRLGKLGVEERGFWVAGCLEVQQPII
jgi:hypothetical protein